MLQGLPTMHTLQGVDPMYVWLPLAAPAGSCPGATRRAARAVHGGGHGVPELQVHMRLQWVRQVERGQIVHLDVGLEGWASAWSGAPLYDVTVLAASYLSV